VINRVFGDWADWSAIDGPSGKTATQSISSLHLGEDGEMAEPGGVSFENRCDDELFVAA
jgi:hypothetical protein